MNFFIFIFFYVKLDNLNNYLTYWKQLLIEKPKS